MAAIRLCRFGAVRKANIRHCEISGERRKGSRLRPVGRIFQCSVPAHKTNGRSFRQLALRLPRTGRFKEDWFQTNRHLGTCERSEFAIEVAELHELRRNCVQTACTDTTAARLR